MKQFPRKTDEDYDWKISIPLRALMFADEARIEYGKKKKDGSVAGTKDDMDALKEANRLINEGLEARKEKSQPR